MNEAVPPRIAQLNQRPNPEITWLGQPGWGGLVRQQWEPGEAPPRGARSVMEEEGVEATTCPVPHGGVSGPGVNGGASMGRSTVWGLADMI